MKVLTCSILAILTAFIVCLTSLLVARSHGVLWNTSSSVPRGLYRTVPDTPVRGALVAVCPPDTPYFRSARAAKYFSSGPCPGGLGLLLKPVAALPGDRVVIERNGNAITVNDQLLPNSKPVASPTHPELVHPYPAGTYVVPVGRLWLLSTNHPYSWDSRYYGPLPDSLLRGVVRPFCPFWSRPR